MTPVFALVILSVGAAAAYWDLRWRTIPNWLTAPAFLLGLAFHGWSGGLKAAGLAALVGFLAGFLFWQLGAIGGGDAKLLAALGAMLGWHLWWISVTIAIAFAALLGLMQLAWRGRLIFLASDLKAIMRGWRDFGLRPHPEHNIQTPGAATAPFGVALGLGVACALLLL